MTTVVVRPKKNNCWFLIDCENRTGWVAIFFYLQELPSHS